MRTCMLVWPRSPVRMRVCSSVRSRAARDAPVRAFLCSQAISSPLSQAKGWMRKQMSTRSSWMAAPWRFRNSMAQLGPSAGGENDGGSRDAVEDGGVSAAAAGGGTAIDAGWC